MFSLILKVKIKALLRLMGEEWPTYFLLGPIMVGAALLLGRRIFNDFAAHTGKIEPIVLTDEMVLRLTFALFFLKVFFNVLPLARRLYPSEQSLSVEDLLPIEQRVRYRIFYLEQLLRDLPFFVLAIFVLIFFGGRGLVQWTWMMWLLFPAVEIGWTLSWIHVRLPNRYELLGVLLMLLGLTWLLPIETLGVGAGLIAPFFALIGYWGYGRWRTRDIGRVEQLLLQAETNSRFFQAISGLVPKELRPLILRDLLLTFRNFVPLFWRNLALALILILATAIRGRISPLLLSGACVYLLASTASTLFALQRPFRGFDYALPLPVERIWRAKVFYAVLLSLPIPWLVWAIEIMVRPVPFSEGFSLLIRLLLVAVAVASLTGGTICEGDQKPALHYIVAGFLSFLAILFIGAFHPLLFVLLFPVLSHLRGSAIARLEQEEIA